MLEKRDARVLGVRLSKIETHMIDALEEATGLSASNIVRHLIRKEYDATCVVREESKPKLPKRQKGR